MEPHLAFVHFHGGTQKDPRHLRQNEPPQYRTIHKYPFLKLKKAGKENGRYKSDISLFVAWKKVLKREKKRNQKGKKRKEKEKQFNIRI